MMTNLALISTIFHTFLYWILVFTGFPLWQCLLGSLTFAVLFLLIVPEIVFHLDQYRVFSWLHSPVWRKKSSS